MCTLQLDSDYIYDETFSVQAQHVSMLANTREDIKCVLECKHTRCCKVLRLCSYSLVLVHYSVSAWPGSARSSPRSSSRTRWLWWAKDPGPQYTPSWSCNPVRWNIHPADTGHKRPFCSVFEEILRRFEQRWNSLKSMALSKRNEWLCGSVMMTDTEAMTEAESCLKERQYAPACS